MFFLLTECNIFFLTNCAQQDTLEEKSVDDANKTLVEISTKMVYNLTKSTKSK